MNFLQHALAKAARGDRDARMAIYPFLLGAVVNDAGGKLEISEKSIRECHEALQNKTARSLLIINSSGGIVLEFEREGGAG